MKAALTSLGKDAQNIAIGTTTPAEENVLPNVGMSKVDSLPLKTLPAPLHSVSQECLKESLSVLVSEGVHGHAFRRLLVRDIELARIQCRFFTGLVNAAIEELLAGKVKEKRVRLLQDLAEQHHRRMIKSIELLARISSSCPSIRVHAHQVGISVGGDK